MCKLWTDLGEIGKEKFWVGYNQFEQNRDLWKAASQYYDSEIHT